MRPISLIGLNSPISFISPIGPISLIDPISPIILITLCYSFHHTIHQYLDCKPSA